MSVPASRSPASGAPPGSAERVQTALRLRGDPLLVLHGPGVTDVFVSRDYQERGIDQVLWAQLRAAGFERIVYATAFDALYYRDDVSAGLAGERPTPAADQPAAGAAAPTRMRHFAGPQGNRMSLGAGRPGGARSVTGALAVGVASSARTTSSGPGGSTTTSESVSANASAGAGASDATGPTRRRRGMTDDDLVRILHFHLTQTTVRTAVVLVRAEQLLGHITGTTARALAEAFGEWVGGHRTENLCVLLFQNPDRARIADEVRRLGRYPALADWLDHAGTHGRGYGLIGPPMPAEVERAVQVARLRRGLRIEDWTSLDRLVAAMAAEPTGIRQWLSVLAALAADGTPLSGPALARAGHLAGGAPDGRTAWERLEALVGLAGVKDHVRQLANRQRLAAARPASAGPPPEAAARHLVFTGNPGTGKTTVARLIGEIYRDLGVLGRGHVVAPKVSDLVTQNVGGTPEATTRVIDEALDGVLFVDEAYRLTERADDFSRQALDTLLDRMEDDRDRLVVIAAGYSQEMRRFFDANPGLRSRFPAANVIHFPDYGVDELFEILLANLRATGLTWEPATSTALREVVAGLHRARDQRFGNAREMRELAADLVGGWSTRVTSRPHPGTDTPPIADAALWHEPLLPVDIPERYRVHLRGAVPPIDAVLAELDALVGLAPVRDQLRALHQRLRHRQRIGAAGIVAPHLLFVGPPGTGKTTVARLVGRMFHALGLLPRPDVVETGRAELVAGYLGQTAIQTQAMIDRARGGVLFIDEAYALAQGGPQDFGREAINTLVPAMTNLRGQLVVIAAGYPDAIAELLAKNEGLASRFGQTVEFPDYPPDDLVTILERMAAPDYALDPSARPAVAAWFTRCRAADPRAFANARTAGGLLEQMEARLAARTLDLPDDTEISLLTTLTAADLPG